jgi:phospholipase/carboxylesterase
MSRHDLNFIHKFVPASDHGSETETLVLLHGTGGNEEDLIPLAEEIAQGVSLLGIRGQVIEDGMPRFFRRLAEGVFDEEDLIYRTHELAGFLEQAVQTYNLNPHRLTAVGYSNGANIAASLMLLEPVVFSRAVLFRAMVPLVPDALPKLSGKAVWLSAGRQDPIIEPQNTERLASMLQSAGAEVTLKWQNTGHGLIRTELGQAADWLGSRD